MRVYMKHLSKQAKEQEKNLLKITSEMHTQDTKYLDNSSASSL